MTSVIWRVDNHDTKTTVGRREMQVEKLTIIRPDDFHLHLRDDGAMADVVMHSAKAVARAIVMPNLKPPIVSVQMAAAYRQRIISAMPEGIAFEPLMTLYLTPATTVAEIERAAASDFVHGVKLYPAGATTNSEAGLASLDGAHAVNSGNRSADLLD